VAQRVVPASESGGRQNDPQHLRVTVRRPQSECIKGGEGEEAREKRVEKVEDRRAHHERKEE
jgi:hypothetical protein